MSILDTVEKKLASRAKESVKARLESNAKLREQLGLNTLGLRTLYAQKISDIINNPEFLNQVGDLQGQEVLQAYDRWVTETPIRQQERVAKASIDLGLENTPEVIAGGTARNMTQQRRRVGGNTSSSLASALGLGITNTGAVSTSLGVS